MELDPSRYPLTSQYLSAVPGGFGAYPDCTVMTEYSCIVQAEYPELWRDPLLPPAIQEALSAPWQEEDWIPAVQQITQSFIVRDRFSLDDSAYLRQVYQRSLKMFSKPFYKVMSHVFSPTTFLMGASRHWATRHRGDTLASRGGDRTSHVLQLTFPPHLYPIKTLWGYGTAFKALLEATGVRQSTLGVTLVDPGTANFTLKWMAKS